MLLNRAQVSLDFLLTLLAFLMIFAALLPFSMRAYHAGVFALDSVKAKNFSDSLKSAVSGLRVLGNGSNIQITVNPSLKWGLSAKSKELILSVKSTALGEQKDFSVFFPNSIIFPETEFDSKKSFVLRKHNGLILFEHSN